MGYRSEVVAAIGMPSMDFIVQKMAALKLLEDQSIFEFILGGSSVREEEMNVSDYLKGQEGYEPLPPGHDKWYIWEFEENDIKWYDSYPDIQAWDAIMEEAGEKGMYVQFLRVGEETGDVTNDTLHSVDMDLLAAYMKKIGMFPDANERQFLSYVKQYEWNLECVSDVYAIHSYINIDISDEYKAKHQKNAEEVLSGKV